MTQTAPIPDGSVIITPTQVYTEVRATRDAVQALGSKLDSIPTQIADHETRIRAMERRIWVASGAASVLGGAAGYIAQALGG